MSKKIRIIFITLFSLLVMLLLTTCVNAETMSEEFKQILNEDGDFVVTDTTMQEDKIAFLRQYIEKYTTNSYWFSVVDYNESDHTCGISLSIDGGEYHRVNIVYKEQFSEDFKSILKEGKIPIPSSNKNDVERQIDSYLDGINYSKENYFFEVFNYWDGTELKKLLDENYTKVTIRMKNKTGKILEQHTIELSYLTMQSEEFKENLNKDGKLELNAAKPSNEEEFITLFELLVIKDENGKGKSFSHLSEDFTSCDLNIYNETHTVDIVYNYDKSIQKKLQNLVNNFPKDIEYFKVEDMEFINYWISNKYNNNLDTFAGYSGELKSYINSYNVKLKVDNRGGDYMPFITGRIGMALITYDDIAYYAKYCLGTRGEHIIYVPDETGNLKEDLIAAAQKRISEYLGKDNIVTVSYGGKAYDIWVESEYETSRWMWELDYPNMTLEEFKAMGNVFIPTYEKFEDVIGINGVDETTDTFIVTVKVGDKEEKHNILIRKDSSKMITPTYKTADMTTDVEINSDSTTIPLDTSVQAKRLTNGEEYEKIIKLLDVKENAMFDLKLYSNSTEEYVERLENGLFEVKIPIPDNLKGKELVAYYTTGTGEPEEFEVEIKDGYAIFKTNHFSIYTLAKSKTTNDNNTSDNNTSDNNTINTDDDKNNNNSQIVDKDSNTELNDNNNNASNPQTGDNILLFVGTSLISIAGIIIITKLKKSYKAK